MRVLLTGATGFLGYHLCSRLLARGDHVTALHRQDSNTTRIHTLGARCMPGDLLDSDMLRRTVRGYDAIIHAAADIRYWPPSGVALEQANVFATRAIARASRLERIGRLLYVSSVAAIGIPSRPEGPADEGFGFNLEGAPLPYHLSKKLGEDAVLEEVYNGLDAVIVNPASIFGPHGTAYRGGEMIRKVRSGKIVPYFTGGICAVHVADVVRGTLAALQQGTSGNRYILGGENLSYREIARRSLTALGLHRPLVPIPQTVTAALAAFRVPRFNPASHYCCNRFQYYLSDKAHSTFGYNPRGFDAIIRECLSYGSVSAISGSAEVAL